MANTAARAWSCEAPTTAKKILVDNTSKLPPRTSGLPKSARLSTKPRRKALARPGRISGKEIVENVVHGLARKVCEASSRVGLTPSTTPISKRKAVGVNDSSCAKRIPGRPYIQRERGTPNPSYNSAE